MIITFVGHGSLYNCDDLSEKVRKAIIDNTQSEDNIIFYCGGYKSFCYAKRKKKYVINLA